MVKIGAQIFLGETTNKEKVITSAGMEEHIRQSDEAIAPQEPNMCLVGSLFRVITHILNACLGTALLNHTELAHGFSSSIGLKTSQFFVE